MIRASSARKPLSDHAAGAGGVPHNHAAAGAGRVPRNHATGAGRVPRNCAPVPGPGASPRNHAAAGQQLGTVPPDSRALSEPTASSSVETGTIRSPSGASASA